MAKGFGQKGPALDSGQPSSDRPRVEPRDEQDGKIRSRFNKQRSESNPVCAGKENVRHEQIELRDISTDTQRLVGADRRHDGEAARLERTSEAFYEERLVVHE
jgi:hypothetical protein